MLLVHDGKVALDDRIARYVPEMAPRFSTLTLRHLLTHTSGIEDYTEMPGWDAVENKPLRHAEIVARIAGGRALFAPGTNWRYSNSGFFLLGLVIERASGEPYGAFVAGRIFNRRIWSGHLRMHRRRARPSDRRWSRNAGGSDLLALGVFGWRHLLDARRPRENARLMARVPRANTVLGELKYIGGDRFALTPFLTVRCLGPATRAEWGISYEAALMMDAKRRAR